MISKRAAKLVEEPSPLVVAYFECLKNPYSLENEEGHINLGVAENHLIDEELLELINSRPQLEKKHFHYNESFGMRTTRDKFVSFLEKFLGLTSLDSDSLVLGTGLSSILENLSYCLFDEGDAIIIPSPYYSGFKHALCSRFGVEIIDAPLRAEDNFKLNLSAIVASYKSAKASGKKVRALLITSPNNPLGQTYSKEELITLINFCKNEQLELIADEVYANSIYGEGEFLSLYELGRDYRQHIHFLYGLAKDFCLSGFKIGLYATENTKVLRAMKELSYFSAVSTYAQLKAEEILGDLELCEKIFSLSKLRLREGHMELSKVNERTLNLPILPAHSGVFVWLDFSKYLEEDSFAGEMRLYNKIWQEGRINITPGQFFSCESPGWFRLCFAKDKSCIQAAFSRMQNILESM